MYKKTLQWQASLYTKYIKYDSGFCLETSKIMWMFQNSFDLGIKKKNSSINSLEMGRHI